MIVARAPLRIPLGGGGTDLPSYASKFGGFVLSAAITKYVYIFLNRPSADQLLRIKYSKYEQVERVDDIQHDLVRPALRLMNVESALEIASMADVPAGTGLGSSGSYLVALLTALHAFKRAKSSTQDIAEMASRIEIEMAGHPAGKHDHYIAAFGGLTALDIAPDGVVVASPLDVPDTTLEELTHGITLHYTGITRASRDILEEQRTATDALDAAVLESLHETKALGYRIRDALTAGDLDAFGRLLDEHWQVKKRRSPRISVPHIDHCYARARAEGALGGKIIGAGGGGFLMLYTPQEVKRRVRRAMSDEGLVEMQFGFDFDGAKVFLDF